MPLLTDCQRTEEWLTAREGKITASLAAACLGLDPYRSAKAAWREIVGKKTDAEKDEYRTNRHMQWGVQFEATARLDYEVETGYLVEETGFWVHPSVPWLGASPDGLIGEDGLAEIKCPTVPPERVPLHHRIQIQVQLAVTGRRWCDYFSWGASGKKFLDRVHRKGIPGLIVALERFYLAYVVPQIEPPRKRSRRKQVA